MTLNNRRIVMLTAMIFYGLWIVLSGKLDAIHLTMGGVCVGCVMWSTRQLRSEIEKRSTELTLERIVMYIVWLSWQICLASLHVALAIGYQLVGSPHKVDPHIVTFTFECENELARMILGQSITLTPGTVTIDALPDGTFIVHALSPTFATGISDMVNHVLTLFGQDTIETSIVTTRFEIDGHDVPQVYDWAIGVGALGTKAIVLIMLMGTQIGRIEMYLDIAIAYAAFNYGGTLVFAKYLNLTNEHSRENGRRFATYIFACALAIGALAIIIHLVAAPETYEVPLLSSVLLLTGAATFLWGCVGFFVMPDAFCRIHPGGKLDTVALMMMCLACTGFVESATGALKLVVISISLILANPSASQATARSAYRFHIYQQETS